MFSPRVFVFLALLLIIGGGLAIVNGYDIIQFERGWSQVIAGATALSAGILTYALAALLRAVEAQAIALRALEPQSSAKNHASSANDDVASPSLPAPSKLVPSMPRPAAKTPAPPPAAAAAPNTFEEAVAQATQALSIASDNAPAPASTSQPKMAVLKADAPKKLDDVPLPPPPLRSPADMPAPMPSSKASLDERLPWKRKKAESLAAQSPQLPPLPLPDVPAPKPNLEDDVTYAPPMPAAAPLMAPTSSPFDAQSLPPAARPKLGDLFRKVPRGTEPPAPPAPPTPVPPFPPGYAPMRAEEPLFQPLAQPLAAPNEPALATPMSAPLAPPLTPPFDPMRATPADNAHWQTEPQVLTAQSAPEVYVEAEESQAHQFYQPIDTGLHLHQSATQTYETDPQHQAPEVRVQPPDEPHVTGHYEANGTHYVLYSDGSIEADTGVGVYRFASINELKSFIDEREAQMN